MTITITKKHVVYFLIVCCFLAATKLAYECGKDSGRKEAEKENREQVRSLTERIEDMKDSLYEKKIHTIKTYAAYRIQ